MWDHVAEKHNGDIGENDGAADFKMELYKVDRDPLRRVLREAIRIKKAEGEIVEVPDPQHEEVMHKVRVTLLNDKREWFCPTIVTVTAHEM